VNIVSMPLPHFLKGRKSPPEMIVVHYSAGYTAQSCFNALNAQKLSAHFTIDRDGTIVQHVDMKNRAFHAGGASSTWLGAGNVNSRSIGIELVNFGWTKAFTEAENKLRSFVSPKDDPEVGDDLRPVATTGRRENQVRVLTRQPSKTYPDHRPAWRSYQWCDYPAVQIRALIELTIYIKKAYPTIITPNIVGHEHCDPQRKVDPGPAFPWAAYLHLVDVEDKEAKAKDIAYRQASEMKQSDYLREATRSVQSHLVRLGLLGGRIDGSWGRLTQAAAVEAVATFGTTYGWGSVTPDANDPDTLIRLLTQVPGFPSVGVR
jgi:N-acetyl-anhydromuramyl-L-alanine amidase AmpD